MAISSATSICQVQEGLRRRGPADDCLRLCARQSWPCEVYYTLAGAAQNRLYRDGVYKKPTRSFVTFGLQCLYESALYVRPCTLRAHQVLLRHVSDSAATEATGGGKANCENRCRSSSHAKRGTHPNEKDEVPQRIYRPTSQKQQQQQQTTVIVYIAVEFVQGWVRSFISGRFLSTTVERAKKRTLYFHNASLSRPNLSENTF